jgi:cellulose synthase (UDP-forming)
VTGGKGRPESPFNFIIPQVLTFVFLALTSVVAIWRDIDNSQLTLATGWNVTNTAILAVFMVVALRESARNRRRLPATRTTPELATAPPLPQPVPARALPGWDAQPALLRSDEPIEALTQKEVVA